MAERPQQEVVEETDAYGHPRIPYRGHYDRSHCDLRRGWVERFTSSSLREVGQWWEGEGKDDSRSCLKLKGNIESPIGLVKVPLAVAGPLLVRGKHMNGYALVPCVTTEGALVASITRGAAALTRAGGVHTLASEQRQIRAPSFVTRNAAESEQLWQWLQSHAKELQEQVRLYSRHATLVDLAPFRQGRTLVVRLTFTTGDASGQNMVTTATSNACKWALTQVEKELPGIRVKDYWVETGLSLDKETSHAMLTLPRGVHVQAEAWIPESVFKSTLKVDLATFLAFYSTYQDGKQHVGAVGSTINIGNLIAAVFIATGQDVAALPECANGLLIVRPATREEIESQGADPSTGSEGEGVAYAGAYVCLVIPGLVIATVGGGTQLATQRECLSMLGCYGKDGIFRLAEIIAGFALGLDISLLAALASGQFATAHEKLGRNHPSHGLKQQHLNSKLFQRVVGDRGTVEAWTPFDVNTGNSILSELTKRELSKKVGHFGFHVTYTAQDGSSSTLPVVLKTKPTDIEVCNMVNKMAQGCGLKLAVLYEKYKMETDFRFCSQREVEISRLENPVLSQFMPVIYHTIADTSKDMYVIVMEYLSRENCSLLDTVDDVSVWTLSDIKVVLRDLAHVHSVHLSQSEWLSSQAWLESTAGSKMAAMAALWRALMTHAHQEFPKFWTTQRVDVVNQAINSIPHIWAAIDSAPHTLIHNDCNPRNICIRRSPLALHSTSHAPLPDMEPRQLNNRIDPKLLSDPDSRIQITPMAGRDAIPYKDSRNLCLYDWELSTVEVPQYDVVEFLCFTLLPSTPAEVWLDLVEFYRQHLEYYSGVTFPVEKFVEVFHGSLFHFAMKRLALYTMAHTHKDYRYLPRVVDTLFSFLTAQLRRSDFKPAINHLTSRL